MIIDGLQDLDPPEKPRKIPDARQKEMAAVRRTHDMLRRIRAKEDAANRAKLSETEFGRALCALESRLASQPIGRWPSILEAQGWLFDADKEQRWVALRLIREAYDAIAASQGVEPLNDPLPDEPLTPWLKIRNLFTDRPAVPASHPVKEKTLMITLTITVACPADVEEAKRLLSGLFDGPAAATPVALDLSEDGQCVTGADKKTRYIGSDPKPAKPKKVETIAATQVSVQDEASIIDSLFVEPDPIVEEPKVTPEAVLTSLQEYAKILGPSKLKQLLGSFQATKFGEIKSDQYGAVLAAVAEAKKGGK